MGVKAFHLFLNEASQDAFASASSMFDVKASLREALPPLHIST